MPQLDNLIVLPQTFWLILIFTSFYFAITFFFLPILIRTSRSKKYLLEHNRTSNLNLLSDILSKNKNLTNNLNKSFDKIRTLLFGKVLDTNTNFKQKPFKQKYTRLTTLLLVASIKSASYCNTPLLNILKFHSTPLKGKAPKK